MALLQHPTLGLVKGTATAGTIQYNGLKYASLEHAFSTPKIFEPPRSELLDASQRGPAVIGDPSACHAEYALIQQSLDNVSLPLQSATECLNLTITVPDLPATAQRMLPVFVFIHGGALASGSGTWPQYDHAALVQQSVSIGKPMIGVNINYRTGIFGFLTSRELREEGFTANNGFRDQKTAFQWIKRHIAGFCGDPGRITALGQSAGGISATYLLQSHEPLFERLVVMSGTCLLFRPLHDQMHEELYRRFCDIQGLSDHSTESRIEAVRNGNASEMFSKMPPDFPYMPALDDDLVQTAVTFESASMWQSGNSPTIAGTKWCKFILIGDCQSDGHIYQLALSHRQQSIAQHLEKSLKSALSGHDEQVDELLRAYGISTAKDDEAAYREVLKFGNDICFYLPSDTFARNWPGIAYAYHLNEQNPWQGPFQGESTHIFDIVLLFKNFDSKLPSATRQVAQSFSNAITSFINGEEPWPKTTLENPLAQLYGGVAGSGQLVADRPETVGRRNLLFAYKDSIGWDALITAFVKFLAGH